VILAGHVITGACVSLTLTVKVHWLLLPLPSCAVFGQPSSCLPGRQSAGRHAHYVGHRAVVCRCHIERDVAGAGPRRRVHSDIGRTCDHRGLGIIDRHREGALAAVTAAVPAPCLVTVVVPTGKAKPLGGKLSTLVTAQLSVAVTLNVTLLVHSPGGAFTVIFAGQVITGAWVSLTVTVKVHWLLLPLLSRAVLVTVVVPTGKAKPLGGTLSTFVTTQLSVAVTLNVTLLVHSPGGVFTVILAGNQSLAARHPESLPLGATPDAAGGIRYFQGEGEGA